MSPEQASPCGDDRRLCDRPHIRRLNGPGIPVVIFSRLHNQRLKTTGITIDSLACSHQGTQPVNIRYYTVQSPNNKEKKEGAFPHHTLPLRFFLELSDEADLCSSLERRFSHRR